MTGKTLAELNVQPGDVVACWNESLMGKHFTIDDTWEQWIGRECKWWTIVSRAPVAATPTLSELQTCRDMLAAELADVDAQIAAHPKTVRVWAYITGGGEWWFSGMQGHGWTLHRDFIIGADGILEGFVPVEGV